jgi:hypothetical protein
MYSISLLRYDAAITQRNHDDILIHNQYTQPVPFERFPKAFSYNTDPPLRVSVCLAGIKTAVGTTGSENAGAVSACTGRTAAHTPPASRRGVPGVGGMQKDRLWQKWN